MFAGSLGFKSQISNLKFDILRFLAPVLTGPNGDAMIGKKTMLWIGAGLVSAVSIPAIGATLHRHHKLVHVKPVSHAAQVFHAVHRASIKPATHTVKHAVKPATLLASHVVKKNKSLKTKVANSASL